MAPGAPEITDLLQDWKNGDREALNRLMPVVYDELRRAARNYMRRERTDHSLQATALVNEVYLRLVDATRVEWRDRAHFFAIAASMMRRILLDAARTRAAAKRGGGDLRITFNEDMLAASNQAAELIAIDDALGTLQKMDPRKAQVVELRFFGGLSVEEIAEVLRMSPQSIKRDWKLARAWLLQEMAGPAAL
jgi:RNA polymerase sigma factor (TIGR02999 family)